MINDNNPNIYVIGEFSDIFNDSNSQTSPPIQYFSVFIFHSSPNFGGQRYNLFVKRQSKKHLNSKYFSKPLYFLLFFPTFALKNIYHESNTFLQISRHWQ